MSPKGLDRGNKDALIAGFYHSKEEHSPYFSVDDLTQESVIGGV